MKGIPFFFLSYLFLPATYFLKSTNRLVNVNFKDLRLHFMGEGREEKPTSATMTDSGCETQTQKYSDDRSVVGGKKEVKKKKGTQERGRSINFRRESKGLMR